MFKYNQKSRNDFQWFHLLKTIVVYVLRTFRRDLAYLYFRVKTRSTEVWFACMVVLWGTTALFLVTLMTVECWIFYWHSDNMWHIFDQLIPLLRKKQKNIPAGTVRILLLILKNSCKTLGEMLLNKIKRNFTSIILKVTMYHRVWP